MKISGVYKITNNITGEFYIGSSKDIKHRWANHKSPSKWKQHPNSKLYKAMAQYGKDKFIVEVIEKTDNLKEREQYWIEQLKPSYNNNWAQGWNIEMSRLHSIEYHKAHRDEYLAKSKDYYYTHRDKQLAKSKANYIRLCFYEGETLTLGALNSRFRRQGIPHPYKEASKHLLP